MNPADEATSVSAGDEDRASATPDDAPPALFPPEEAERFQGRWRGIQSGFVDNPRDAVKAADQLVDEVVQAVARSFAERKRGLEEQWDRADHIDTEVLRQALQKYRAFFQRLLDT